ncbi:MAG TPA: CDP-diacylglycerol--glycerol-3-phosphate 3-phosphatidyltransferase [Clostridiaceae bacterium]|nr:CDP-diacylglycerol--glycerol-3-phosphate 3-phosphatidyltransferase [Clostridiaceae bacterium]
MNLPNKLTVVRIALVPVILLLMLPWSFLPTGNGWTHFVGRYGMLIAVILFIVASITDFFDGQIARRQNLITTLGQFMDPIADKFLVTSVMIMLVHLQRMHGLVVVVILARDLVVNGLRMLSASLGIVVPANAVGKWKTFMQMIGMILIMIQLSLMQLGLTGFIVIAVGWVGDVLIGISVLLCVISVIQYVKVNRSHLDE